MTINRSEVIGKIVSIRTWDNKVWIWVDTGERQETMFGVSEPKLHAFPVGTPKDYYVGQQVLVRTFIEALGEVVT